MTTLSDLIREIERANDLLAMHRIKGAAGKATADSIEAKIDAAHMAIRSDDEAAMQKALEALRAGR